MTNPNTAALSDKLRDALAELVACKDLKERKEQAYGDSRTPPEKWVTMNDEYHQRQPLAWEAARAALSAAQPAPEVPTKTIPGWVQCPDCNGSAEHIHNDHNGDPAWDYAVPCPTCTEAK